MLSFLAILAGLLGLAGAAGVFYYRYKWLNASVTAGAALDSATKWEAISNQLGGQLARAEEALRARQEIEANADKQTAGAATTAGAAADLINQLRGKPNG